MSSSFVLPLSHPVMAHERRPISVNRLILRARRVPARRRIATGKPEAGPPGLTRRRRIVTAVTVAFAKGRTGA